MTAVIVSVRDYPTEHVLVHLDDVTGEHTAMEKFKPWLGNSTKVDVSPNEGHFPHWLWMARQKVGSFKPLVRVSDKMIGNSSVTQFLITFSSRIRSVAGDFGLGWVLTGSGAGNLTLLSAVLQNDDRTLLFTTATPEVAPNTVNGNYLSAIGDIVTIGTETEILTAGTQVKVLQNLVVPFGAVPA